MKKKLLFIGMILGTGFGFSQCSFVTADLDAYLAASTPAKTWGTMPDTTDNLPSGTVNQLYNETIAIKWASVSTQIPDQLPGINISWFKIKDDITGVEGLPAGITWTSATSTTDDVSCGGPGTDAESMCKWGGGEYGCIKITGTPAQVGVFPITVNLVVKPQGLPLTDYAFNGYSIAITTAGVNLINDNPFNISQNVPNPFSQITNVRFTVKKAATTKFQVINLLGEVVHNEVIQANEGINNIVFDGSTLNEGIYMYTVEINGKKVTKKMVVNK